MNTPLSAFNTLFCSALILGGCTQITSKLAHDKAPHASSTQLVADCMAMSNFSTPYLAGDVIETKNYALVSLSAEPPANTQKGELCIVHKHTGTLEITSTEKLRFTS